MLGAAGEQLAVYNGVQVKYDREDNETERFVYMYLHSFISAGGQLVTLADGTKQFNIVDNLGSVRCIVSWDGASASVQAFDYKPFGDLQSAGEENRIGYFGEQRDKESDYFAMGFRLYDPEIGRFLAIDPLLDMQPSQTPYHYCFNNPTSFTDPTGLYPKKEKGDKVQESMRCDDWELNRALKMLTDYKLSYYEDLFFMVKFNSSLFKKWCLRKYITDQIGSSGHAYSVRIAENGGSGSFTYYNSKNGVMCNVNFRYNKDTQNPIIVVSELVLSLNWQCADEQTSIDLAVYGNSGNSINVDVSMSGSYLAGLYNKHCNKDYKYILGTSKNEWKFKNPANAENACYLPELETGWIYIASEFLNDRRNNDAGKYLTWESGFLGSMTNKSELWVDFNLTFSHEMGHRLDSFNNLYYDEIDVEGNAYERTMRQYRANNPGRYIKIP